LAGFAATLIMGTPIFYLVREIDRRAVRAIDLRNTNLQLAENESRADKANRAKSLFLANMSHELRTPLNAVIGFSQIIKDETFGPTARDRYREYAGDILNAGQHLLDLITAAHDISKIEARKSCYTKSARALAVAGLVLAGCRFIYAAALDRSHKQQAGEPIMIADDSRLGSFDLCLASRPISTSFELVRHAPKFRGRIRIALRCGNHS
jgi:signal transduction histidine kinase